MKPPSKSKGLSQAEIEEKLAQAGVQATAQRIALCQYVLCAADHPTADDVKAWADRNFPKMSLATVYNTLGTLVDVGLLRSFRFPHSEKVVYDHNTEQHYHFLDEENGKVYDLCPSEIDVKPKLQKKFDVKSVEVLLRGKVR